MPSGANLVMLLLQEAQNLRKHWTGEYSGSFEQLQPSKGDYQLLGLLPLEPMIPPHPHSLWKILSQLLLFPLPDTGWWSLEWSPPSFRIDQKA
jgi:hypothetical protein